MFVLSEEIWFSFYFMYGSSPRLPCKLLKIMSLYNACRQIINDLDRICCWVVAWPWSRLDHRLIATTKGYITLACGASAKNSKTYGHGVSIHTKLAMRNLNLQFVYIELLHLFLMVVLWTKLYYIAANKSPLEFQTIYWK